MFTELTKKALGNLEKIQVLGEQIETVAKTFKRASK